MNDAVPAAVIGVGTDLVDVDRIRVALERTPGLRDRVFTPAEYAHSARHRDPAPHLAGRFAVKEAVMKALGQGFGSVSFTDIEVINRPSGEPDVALTGRAATAAADRAIGTWRVSLTHTATLAHAVALALP